LNGSLWTIPVELAFYVAVPVIYLFLRKAGRDALVLLPLILLSFAIQWMAFLYPGNAPLALIIIKVVGVTPLPWIGMFACGIVAQRNISVIYPFVAGRFFLFLAAYAAIATASYIIPAYPILRGNLNFLGLLNFIALALLVLAAAFSCRSVADRILKRNDLSYGIYIYHMPIVNVLAQQNIRGAFGVAAAVGGAFTLALLSWFGLEKPLLGLRRHSLHARKGQTVEHQRLTQNVA
jgi:peptidoglycan/LPS O-acetylase OafA/YrhL